MGFKMNKPKWYEELSAFKREHGSLIIDAHMQEALCVSTTGPGISSNVAAKLLHAPIGPNKVFQGGPT